MAPERLDPDRLLSPDGRPRPAWVADRMRGAHPAAAAMAVVAAGWATCTAALVAVGLLVTRVLDDSALGRGDVEAVRWFEARRGGLVDRLAGFASQLGSTPVIVGVAALVVVVLARRGHWREALLVVLSLTVEVLSFLATTAAVDRPRPPVGRLEVVPPTSSFPSGHTAASVCLYLATALLLQAHRRHHLLRTVAWLAAPLVPLVVAISRLQRGMHHPIDVIAGAVLGLAALGFGLLAVRAASGVAERREAAEGRAPTVGRRAAGVAR